MKKILSILLFISIIPSLVSSGFTTHDNYALLQKLNLSSQQEQHLQSLNNNYKSEFQSIHDALHSRQKKLNALLNKESSTNADITLYKKEIQSLQAELSDLQVQFWLEIKQILTSEQKNQLRKLQLD